MDDSVPFASREYFIFLGLLVFSRGSDFLSTWVATPHLVLEGNPIAKWLGWKWGAVVNVILVISAAVLLLRKQRHEEELAHAAQESSNQLKAMVSSAMDAIVTIDSDRRVVVFNPAAQTMFGYSEEQIRGKPLDMLIPERFRSVHERNVAAFSGNPLFHVIAAQAFDQFSVQPRNDVVRRARRCEQGIPGARLITGQAAFGDGRNFRYRC